MTVTPPRRTSRIVVAGFLLAVLLPISWIFLQGNQGSANVKRITEETRIPRPKSLVAILPEDETSTTTSPPPEMKAKIMVVMINSAIKNFVRRQAVRCSWVKLLNPCGDQERDREVVIRFLIGLPGKAKDDEDAKRKLIEEDLLQEEIETYGDIVRVNFEERWTNLAEKTQLMYRWAVDTHPSTPFVYMMDDDSFLRIDHYLPELKQRLEKKVHHTRVYEGVFSW
jgi:hypothetical protein